MGGVGDDFQEPGDASGGAVADVGVGRECEEGGQTLEVDGEVGSGVELGHFPALEVVEPCTDALAADG